MKFKVNIIVAKPDIYLGEAEYRRGLSEIVKMYQHPLDRNYGHADKVLDWNFGGEYVDNIQFTTTDVTAHSKLYEHLTNGVIYMYAMSLAEDQSDEKQTSTAQVDKVECATC